MKLAEYLEKVAGLPEETIRLLDELSDDVSLAKSDMLLKAGSYNNQLFYLEKGLLREYYLKSGKEITQEFFTETSLFVSIESLFFNKPYPHYLEALEDAKLRVIQFAKVESLMDGDPKMQRFAIFLLMSTLKRFSGRLQSLQVQSAQERYNTLMQDHPDILLRAPLGDIASYLGITQSTLSVIRAGKTK